MSWVGVAEAIRGSSIQSRSKWLDVPSAREFYRWEKSGAVGAVEEVSFDIDKLATSFVPRGDWFEGSGL